jgi:ABC-type uncharacterized transport system substrate-binding protein
MRAAWLLAGVLVVGGAPRAGAADAARVGVLVVGEDADLAATREGLAEALARAGGAFDVVERVVPADGALAAAALSELVRNQGADVVVAIGDVAAERARGRVRGCPVVFAAVGDDAADDLRRGGNACVATGVPAGALVAELRRAAPSLSRLGVALASGAGGAGGSTQELRSETDVVIAAADGATPDARAAAVAAKLVPGCDAVWLAPAVPPADAEALARALEGRGIPLAGSRRAHLEAGCAVVVRSDPRDLGAIAAVLVQQVRLGADPAKLPVRRASRRVLDVNLPAAQRLGWRVPLTLLAWADSVVRPLPVKR